MPKKYTYTINCGDRFGRLVIISEMPPRIYEYAHGTIRARTFLVQCDCGNRKIVSLNNLTRKRIVSCGCHKAEHCSRLSKSRAKRSVEVNNGMSE